MPSLEILTSLTRFPHVRKNVLLKVDVDIVHVIIGNGSALVRHRGVFLRAEGAQHCSWDRPVGPFSRTAACWSPGRFPGRP